MGMEVTGMTVEGIGVTTSEYSQETAPMVMGIDGSVVLSKECIDQLIHQMIPIDKKKHCALERNKRKGLREIARKKLYKHYGYE